MSCRGAGASIPLENANEIHVFHAKDDPFCPEEQHMRMSEVGCRMHLHRDNHALCGRATLADIIETILTLDPERVEMLSACR